MTDSAGEAASHQSSAFVELHPRIQRWIWEQNWTELRDAQERAVRPILAGDRDVIISAATAAGKTEAAFLPICSSLLVARESAVDARRQSGARSEQQRAASGVQALYVSPLKALINDQYGRLDALCEHLDMPVHRWHGDVPGSRKAKVLSDPDGILLITPESLEALLVIHGPKVAKILGGLRYVVIDEMHSFLGTERGMQLQSLLHRVELAVRRRVPRIGLSATLGDMDGAAAYLRPGAGARVTRITSVDDTHELKLQLRGYEALPPQLSARQAEHVEASGRDVEAEEVTEGHQLAIADHLYRTLRGTDNLVFANSRREVEIYADLLQRRSEREHVPNEFIPHHGSLSRELREFAESRLKDRETPVSAVCTSTLEMGIDIGSVTSIAQLGAPQSVASMRQRLGRSGRRGGSATMRLYVTEPQVGPQTPPSDALRTELVQSIAMVNLLLDRWNEAPNSGGLHLSTLVQQLLSLIAQHGGVTPLEAYRVLCETGPFASVSRDTFKQLLRALADERVDLLMQASDGLLLHGQAGERLVNHYSFYAAFRTGEEYRLIASGRTLGTLPIDYPLMPGSLLIFGGRRWKVLAVDAHEKVVELIRSSGGRPPTFAGAGAAVADRIRQEMRRVYLSAEVPAYLDATAAQLLTEGRHNFVRYGLGADPLLTNGADTLIFPWRGDRICSTLTVALTAAGIEVAQDGVCLTLSNCTREQALSRLAELVEQGAPDPALLAARVDNKIVEKFDEQLSEELLNEGFAARSLDVEGAWKAARQLLHEARDVAADRPDDARSTSAAAPSSAPAANVSAPDVSTRPAAAEASRLAPTTSAAGTGRRPHGRPELGTTPFAVVDVETTGFSPRLRDRIVEIAIVRTAPDGTVEDSWSTLLNPQRDLGPTHVHGIRGADVLDAPRFLDVAGDVADRLDGAVVVAHNARFDLGFVSSEFTRLGAAPPTWPALCTLALSYRLGALGGGRLADCLTAESLTHPGEHTALGDATATAELLAVYLRRAGGGTLADLGCVPDVWPEALSWSVWPIGGPVRPRSSRSRPEASPLVTLIRHLPAHSLGSATQPADTAAYLDVLSRALEDRRLDSAEVRTLADTARAWGLSRSDVHRAHMNYLEALALTALGDGVVTDLEAEDLADVAAALGFGVGEIAAALHAARARTPSRSQDDDLRGLGVCFTGAFQTRIQGQPITRDQAHTLARAAGLIVHERVTKTLDVLVTADPQSLSEKAEKARSYGTRIMTEPNFWRAIGLT
ncbi:DEAD/DEAH box helicase [Modestobacter sp. VKM Ac-2978]|uniref:DEAD/DEAH box helicase n=1 Tax=Modestobacter sp. VKM Ac-2978 TaxID=3004132 RepID=UPI0022AB4A11|nr:DEAD/DEAH box helicase [Modestobacter sp. VKM Ac-2978]MCZ2849816.1 DEAD/DEAH box helicase [Modestobacter sp. VKM Ac-2978]